MPRLVLASWDPIEAQGAGSAVGLWIHRTPGQTSMRYPRGGRVQPVRLRRGRRGLGQVAEKQFEIRAAAEDSGARISHSTSD